jgi:hypothetical protein
VTPRLRARGGCGGLPVIRRAAALQQLCLVALLVGACGKAAPPEVPAARILFVGNSFTYVNGGIDRQLQGLAPSATAGAVTAGGFRLSDHWSRGEAVARIREGGRAYVVLQEQSQTPVVGRVGFEQYARAFDQEVRAAGGTTVLLMTWERPDSVQYGVTTAGLAQAYTDVAAALGAKVAPAGLAFAEALQERPGLVLTSQDGHPTLAGTYLAACVLYGVIYGRSPVGNPYGPLAAADNAFLQQAAARTLGL